MTTTDSIALIHVPGTSDAYQALSEVRHLDAGLASLDVRSATLLQRRTDGTLHIPEQADARTGEGATTGGLIGMLVGVLGGPLGILLGFGTGALIGGAVDLDRASKVDGVLALLSRQVPPGATVLVLEVSETAPELLDQLAARFGAAVQRQPTDAVIAEVEAVSAASEAAQKEANRVLRQSKRAEARATMTKRVDSIKENLGRG